MGFYPLLALMTYPPLQVTACSTVSAMTSVSSCLLDSFLSLTFREEPNFFGTLKTECVYRAHFSSRGEVEQLVSEYVYFWNFERIALKNGLTPIEIRSKAA